MKNTFKFKFAGENVNFLGRFKRPVSITYSLQHAILDIGWLDWRRCDEGDDYAYCLVLKDIERANGKTLFTYTLTTPSGKEYGVHICSKRVRRYNLNAVNYFCKS
tara:strand:+ start:3060 stop:3374 length:315 start_codon:yes stop_codon:yes gene_type:complete